MHATHPTTIRHLPDWFGAVIGLVLGLLLILAVLAAANLVDFSALFTAKPVDIPTTSEMLGQQFAIEHHEMIYGTQIDQLQRVFFLEHRADMIQ